MILSSKKHILVASSDHTVYDSIYNCLKSRYRIDYAGQTCQALEMFKSKRYEFTFMDLDILSESIPGRPEQKDYLASLSPYRRIFPQAGIIVMTTPERLREAVFAVKAGASNYITFPINADEIDYVTEVLVADERMQSELDYLRDQFWEMDSRDVVQTRSPLMKSVFTKIRSVSPTCSTVMLYGETGTGKGVIAHLIHTHSKRRTSQFIGVHCGAIPDNLIESELFGHEKGAFTGALKRKLGKFEIAHGGTIFLDEIGTISKAAQIKLLQVLQDKTFHRLGGDQTQVADVRIVAATNADLKAMSDCGDFRKDLYYRLNVFPIEIPPLRKRKEDIPHLVKTFLNRLDLQYSKSIQDVHPIVSQALLSYDWPGNIRELENLIERAYILESSHILTPESFPGELFETSNDATITQIQLQTSQPLCEVRRKAIENVERQYLKEILTLYKGRINHSASAAGLSTRQLHKLLVKYGLKKEDFK